MLVSLNFLSHAIVYFIRLIRILITLTALIVTLNSSDALIMIFDGRFRRWADSDTGLILIQCKSLEQRSDNIIFFFFFKRPVANRVF